MDILIHSANVLYLVSYVMRNILWLRVFTVIGASCLMAYLYFRPDPLITAVCWNVVFVLLNLYWIVRLILERRPVRLSEDERRLCALVFRTITPREMINLLKLGTWERAQPGQHLSQRGAPLDRLMLIYSGAAAVEVASLRVGELHPGQFVGSLSFITEETASADVIALEPTRYVAWPKARLKTYLAKNPELHAAIEVMLGSDLAHRLQDCWAHQRPEHKLAASIGRSPGPIGQDALTQLLGGGHHEAYRARCGDVRVAGGTGLGRH